ncbi:hypothetical protein HDU93_003738 [Gonapodya sp. JEL0774]|nr:hypothetical protein HDU93_003738 [Gonapodya sp. JEL0774]
MALTIAGSDSGGGAGIQADLKTFTALGVYGTSVLTACTAQNTLGVQAVHSLPPEFVEQQLKSVLGTWEDAHSGGKGDVMECAAIKTGMLSSAPIIHTISNFLRTRFRNASLLPKLVIDPVMISTSGHALLEPDGVHSMLSDLVPLAWVLTPNIPEAEAMVRHAERTDARDAPFAIREIGDMVSACGVLHGLGANYVLVKGGHRAYSYAELARVLGAEVVSPTAVSRPAKMFAGGFLHIGSDLAEECNRDVGIKLAVDVLFCPESESDSVSDNAPPHSKPVIASGSFHFFAKPYLRNQNFHGTGCTLSSAIAGELAKGHSVPAAVSTARDYLQLAIENSLSVGRGIDSLCHFHPITTPISTAHTDFCADEWQNFTKHRFVEEIGQGTLDPERFRFFIRQDYLFLNHYARCWSLVAFKERSAKEIERASAMAKAMAMEQALHVKVIRGISGDLMDLRVALLPCVLGYAVIGRRLLAESRANPSTDSVNPYMTWIETYSSDEYQRVAQDGRDALDKLLPVLLPGINLPIIVDGRVSLEGLPTRLRELCETFRQATNLEVGFWEMAWHMQM